MLIGTWNSQGYKFQGGYLDNILKKYNLDVLCIQECGDLSCYFTKKEHYKYENQIYIGKRGDYHLIYYPWRNHCRCSMAVMVKDDYHIESATLYESNIKPITNADLIEETECDNEGNNGLRKELRPIMMVKIRSDVSSVTICNTHLPSGCPGFARRVGYTFLTGYNPSNFIMVGDMNSLPLDWKLPPNIHIKTAGETYSWDNLSKCYDYCITDITQAYAYETYYPGNSDHLVAIFNFDI